MKKFTLILFGFALILSSNLYAADSAPTNEELLNSETSFLLFNGNTNQNFVVGTAFYLVVDGTAYYYVRPESGFVLADAGENFLTSSTQQGSGNSKIGTTAVFDLTGSELTGTTGQGEEKTYLTANFWTASVPLDGSETNGQGEQITNPDQVFVKATFLKVNDTDEFDSTGFGGTSNKRLPGVPLDGGLGILALMGIGLGVFKRKK